MRFGFYSAALATAVLGLGAFSHAANAVTTDSTAYSLAPAYGSVTVTEDWTNFSLLNPNPLTTTNDTPTNYPNPNILLGITGSLGGQYRSPFENSDTSGSGIGSWASLPYTSVQGGGSAHFSCDGDCSHPANIISILWGSPDAYNTIKFFSGANGGGDLIFTLTGSQLKSFADLSNNGASASVGHDFVTFIFAGQYVQSAYLSSASNAFEFTDFLADPPSQNPIPAALPLFATGLGVIGFLARRRKKLAADARMVTA